MMIAAERHSASRKPSARRRAVFTALLAAIEHVLEEGVTRATLRHLTFGEIHEWERLFTLSEPVVETLRRRVEAPGADVARDPALTQLVVCAAGIAALARGAGLLEEAPSDARDAPVAPDVAALRTLRAAVDAAYRYSRHAHDRALLTAFAQTAA